MPIETILDKLQGVRKAGAGFVALCPAHEDQRHSLSVTEGKDGRALLNCHAGCEAGAICEAVGLKLGDLFPKTGRNGTGKMGNSLGTVVAKYDYRNEAGELLYQVWRYDPKDFRPHRPDGAGGWTMGYGNTRRVPYRLPELRAAPAGAAVFLCEGEKDTDNVRALGLLATTNAGGANAWREEYADSLAGAHICILPDNDPAGRGLTYKQAGSLIGKAASVRILNLPGLPPKGDVSDWLAAGGTREELLALAKAAPLLTAHDLVEPAEPAEPADDEELDNLAGSATPWPEPLEDVAYHGLAGHIVRTLEPHTEADPAALLFQLLTAFGNVVGHGPHVRVGATRHTANLNMVLIGRSSKGRKGTALQEVLQVFEESELYWVKNHVASGLSSGEGLIYAVRDKIEKQEAVKEKGKPTGEFQTVLVDAGIVDKRLLAVEPEFASVLRVAAREGNTISAMLRQAWDSGNLRVLNKNSPLRATGAHISLIGHVTKDELLKFLSDVDMVNGFANRFLWVCTRRSKLLPDGGRVPQHELEWLAEALGTAALDAQHAGEMTRDEEAAEYWRSVYPELSGERQGLLGAVTSRAEAQVLRLSLVYALLDQAPAIQQQHLLAAMGAWRYVERSAAWVFGQRQGDTTQDAILNALREKPEGLTGREVSALFARHKPAEVLRAALDALVERGLVAGEKVQTGGRPREVWRAL